MTEAPVIAIDGPSGAGKGTVAGLVADELGWHLLDSGALYRAVGLTAIRCRIHTADGAALAAVARGLDIAFLPGRVLIDGRDESDAIRTPSVDAAASAVAAITEVRAALLDVQRRCRKPPGLVADGRDMGTNVFPEAPLKVYLTASIQARAERRQQQLRDSALIEPDAGARLRGPSQSVEFQALKRAIKERDARDRGRAVSPFVKAPGAVAIDTTEMTIDEVVAAVRELWHRVADRRGQAT